MKDTSPEIEALVFKMMMERTPEERFLMGTDMFETARAFVLASLPPGATEWDKRRHLLRRFYGDEPELVKNMLAHLDRLEAEEKARG